MTESTNHSDLPEMQLRLSSPEKRKAFKIIKQAKKLHKKEKTIVLHPFGSTATSHASGIFDDSLRSISRSSNERMDLQFLKMEQK